MANGIICSEDLLDRTGRKPRFSPSKAAAAVFAAFPVAIAWGHCPFFRRGIVFLYDNNEPIWGAEAHLRVMFDDLVGDLATKANTRETIALIEAKLQLAPRSHNAAGLQYRKIEA
jgi:hypothetical protein